MRARAARARLLDDRELLLHCGSAHGRVGLHDTRLIHDLEPVGGENHGPIAVVGPAATASTAESHEPVVSITMYVNPSSSAILAHVSM